MDSQQLVSQPESCDLLSASSLSTDSSEEQLTAALLTRKVQLLKQLKASREEAETEKLSPIFDYSSISGWPTAAVDFPESRGGSRQRRETPITDKCSIDCLSDAQLKPNFDLSCDQLSVGAPHIGPATGHVGYSLPFMYERIENQNREMVGLLSTVVNQLNINQQRLSSATAQLNSCELQISSVMQDNCATRVRYGE